MGQHQYEVAVIDGGVGVTGIPGRNVVRQILHDRRTSRWRRHRP